MSIIYDALKKVENTNQNQPKQESSAKLKNKSKFSQYLIFFLIICVGVVTAKIFFDFLYPSKTNAPTNATLTIPVAPKAYRQASILKTQNPPLEPPKAEIKQAPQVVLLENKDEFVLSGVFFSEGQGYALINNQISKVGDLVDEALVMNITIDGVELKKQNETIKLSTRF